MADRRRRRKPIDNGESDDSSNESINEIINHTLSDLGSDAEGANSEYESADEEDLLPAGAAADQENIDPKLDDDEDRKNPQYIPKKGAFYEHDDRSMPPDEQDTLRMDAEEPKGEVEQSYPGASLPVVQISTHKTDDPEDLPTAAAIAAAKQLKKKVWRGDDEKWSHDKFTEFEQAPKAREELVSVYGYDIRSEEGAPRARRRRRYGRGPNKYTRNWEDLEAYTRPARGGASAVGTQPGRGGRGGRGSKGGPGGGPGHQQQPPGEHNNEQEFPSLPGQQQPPHDNSTHGSNTRHLTATEESTTNTSNGSPPDQTTTTNSNTTSSISTTAAATVQYNTQTYTNQGYRRNKQQSTVEERGGRGGRGGRGAGKGGRGRGGGGNWNNSTYPPASSNNNSSSGGQASFDPQQRGSDDVRVSAGRGDHFPQSPQQQQQQKQQAADSSKDTDAAAGATDQHQRHQQHDNNKQVPRNNQQFSPASPHHSVAAPPQQQPPYIQHPAPLQHHPQQQQQQQQQQQSVGTGGQYPRPKRYSTQRPSRTQEPTPPPQQQQQQQRTGGGGGVNNNKGTGVAGVNNNAHYTPHPHHNLYYHDNSTTSTPPPPPNSDALTNVGIPASNHKSASSGSAVVYSGGAAATIYDSSGSAIAVVGTAGSGGPPPGHQFTAPPPPPPNTFVAHNNTFIARAAMFNPIAPAPQLIPAAAGATVLAPNTAVIAVAAAGAPVAVVPSTVVTTVPPPPAGVRPPLPFLPSEPLLSAQFSSQPPPPAPPQPFQPPHPPQFPPFQSYTPVPSEGTQPQEVYRNGVMYYNTQIQQPQRSTATLQKRPKAAIPILPPPDQQQLSQQQTDGDSIPEQYQQQQSGSADSSVMSHQMHQQHLDSVDCVDQATSEQVYQSDDKNQYCQEENTAADNIQIQHPDENIAASGDQSNNAVFTSCSDGSNSNIECKDVIATTAACDVELSSSEASTQNTSTPTITPTAVSDPSSSSSPAAINSNNNHGAASVKAQIPTATYILETTESKSEISFVTSNSPSELSPSGNDTGIIGEKNEVTVSAVTEPTQPEPSLATGTVNISNQQQPEQSAEQTISKNEDNEAATFEDSVEHLDGVKHLTITELSTEEQEHSQCKDTVNGETCSKESTEL